MSDEERAQHYRDEADRCRRLAEAIGDAAMGHQLLRIALGYERLAGQISAEQNLSGCLDETREHYSAPNQIIEREIRRDWADKGNLHASTPNRADRQ